MTQLSPHFSLDEFTRSDAAENIGSDNAPTPEHLENLKTLAKNMEKVRAICGDRRIWISSAYRNPAVNKAVKGVANSAHALGLAADFIVFGMSPVMAAHEIIAAGFEFDQLIFETSRHVLHISFDERMRGQVLTQPGPAGTPCTKGIA